MAKLILAISGRPDTSGAGPLAPGEAFYAEQLGKRIQKNIERYQVAATIDVLALGSSDHANKTADIVSDQLGLEPYPHIPFPFAGTDYEMLWKLCERMVDYAVVIVPDMETIEMLAKSFGLFAKKELDLKKIVSYTFLVLDPHEECQYCPV